MSKITMIVEETVTIRKEITVECDQTDQRDTVEQRLRQEFVSGLHKALGGAGYDACASQGLNYYRTEEDADNGEEIDPDSVAYYRFTTNLSEDDDEVVDDGRSDDKDDAIEQAKSALLNSKAAYAYVEWSDTTDAETVATLYKNADNTIDVTRSL